MTEGISGINRGYQNFQEAHQRIVKEALEVKEKIAEDRKMTTKEPVKKVSRVQDMVSATKASLLNPVRDKVEIRSFTWEQNDKGDYKLSTSEPDPYITAVDTQNKGSKILKSLGHKIDYMSKLPQLKQTYMQSVVQSKTHNLFIATYAQVKVGLLSQLMSTLGVSVEELQKLQKLALEGAIEENIALMSENLYNIELTELIHGRGRKAAQAMRMFKEIELQLMQQMAKLGKETFYSTQKILEEKIKQVKKILEEFGNERHALDYQSEFQGDE